jgi:hypothetical protein
MEEKSMNIALDQIFSILSNHVEQALPEDIVPLSTLTPAQYGAIRAALTAAEQNDLDAGYRLAERSVKILDKRAKVATQKDALSNAIEGLRIIRDLQNLQALMSSLEPSAEKDSLHRTYYSIPIEQRRDLVLRAVSMLGELPLASQREAALRLLSGDLPRETIVVLAKLCHTVEDIGNVFNALPVLALCDESSHVALIVQEIAALPPPVRQEIIDRTVAFFPTSTDSSIVLEVMQQETEILRQQALAVQVVYQRKEFLIDAEDLEKIPEVILANFIEYVAEGHANPRSIGFFGNDMRGPGVAKDFLAKLVRGVCTKLGFTVLEDGCFRPEMAVISTHEQAIYANLASLFTFCMEKKLVIGMQFDPGLFYALAEISESHITDITKGNYKEFWPLYKRMKDFYPSDKASIALMEKALDAEETIEVLLEAMPKAFNPCIALRLCLHLQAGTTAEVLARAVQGTVSAQNILQQLQYVRGVTPQKRALIEAWIRALDNDSAKLKKFLTLVTGAPGLGPFPIQIDISGVSLQAHQCAQLLIFPTTVTLEEGLQELDASLNREN